MGTKFVRFRRIVAFVDDKKSQKTSLVIKGLPLPTPVWFRYRSTGRNKSTQWPTMFDDFVIN